MANSAKYLLRLHMCPPLSLPSHFPVTALQSDRTDSSATSVSNSNHAVVNQNNALCAVRWKTATGNTRCFLFLFSFFPIYAFSLHISPTTDTEECIGPKSPQCETFAYRRSRRTVSACREIIVGIIALVLDLPLKIAVVSGSLRRSNPHGTQKPWDLVAG